MTDDGIGDVKPDDVDVGFVDCYGCDRSVVVRAEQRTHYYKREVDAAFRCYVCGRVFCSDCAPEHFGIDGSGRG